jgi:hypothetical protein
MMRRRREETDENERTIFWWSWCFLQIVGDLGAACKILG